MPKVKWEVTSTSAETNGTIPALTKRLVGHVDNSSYPLIAVDIQMTLSTPANATTPVPVMLEFGFLGTNRFAFGRGTNRLGTGVPWQQQVLAKGWGYAIISPSSIQPDNGAGLTRGIIGLVNKGQPRKAEDWGALRAWAWGASRALDYLETDKSVDATQVGIEGLSRYGKAALVAMAYDTRFAIGFIGSSGEGGAKLHRRTFGELVENLTGSGGYHWMAGSFLKYGGPLNAGDLPVDAHELIALCAPRPTFISYGASEGPGAEGRWVDQKGSFMAAVAAGPVFRLLGKKDLGTSEFPAVETGLVDGELAWRQHSGGHTTGPNWPTFLEWAARYITPAKAVELWPGTAPGETGNIGPERFRMSPELDRKQVEVTNSTKLITGVTKPTLTIHRPPKDNDTGTSVLICPGGGYWNLYWQLEGEEIASWLNSIGVTGILLKYRVPRRPGEPEKEPAPRALQDAQRAVSLVRSKATEWGLNPDRIGIVGFSAGGHLAVATATSFDKRTYDPVDEVDKISCRPDFAMAIYSGYLKAKDADELHPSLGVPTNAPPIFLAHGSDDIISPPEHSVLMYLALKRAGVPAELHVYATATHDFGARPIDHPCSTWTESCGTWLRHQGLLHAKR
jgi:acetyl esterase/lipase